MKSEKIYQAWKDEKQHIEVKRDFTESVMGNVYQHQQKKRKPLFELQRFVELVSAYPLAKAGIIAIGTITGLVRVAFMIHVLLFGN